MLSKRNESIRQSSSSVSPENDTEEPFFSEGVSPKVKFQTAAKVIGAAAMREKEEAAQKEKDLQEQRQIQDATLKFQQSTKTKVVQPRKTATVTPPSNVSENNWTKVAYAAKIAALASKNKKAAINQKLFARSVVSAKTWDVWSPPPLNSVSGRIVPRLMNQHKNRRRCSLEIHKVTPVTTFESEQDGTLKPYESHSYEECVIRLLLPATKELNRKVKTEALKHLFNKDTVSSAGVFNEQEEIRDMDLDDDDEDDANSINFTNINDESSRYFQLADHGGKSYDGWKPKYSLPMHGIYIRNTNKKSVQILVSFSDFKQERELIFDTIGDAKDFVKCVGKQKNLEMTRQDDRLNVALGGDLTLPKFETVTFLFEIVAGYDLPIGDYLSSDPYVIAIFGHQEVHRTEIVSKTLNPIWTLKTGSLFLLQVESRRFFIEEGMKFVVKDYDKLGKHEVLGVCKIDPKVFYTADGERMEFKLMPPYGSSEKEVPGTLVLRCRRATLYDQQFMEEFQKQEGKNVKGVASYNAPEANTNVLKTLTTKVKKRDKEDGILKYKVRPGPDPKRPPDDTEWLSNDELQETVLEPSRQWVDMGEGTLGKIYVEILGCDDLPNMDSGGFYGNKTDTFVACVYEDVYGRTDVIDDCLSPRWLPWTNRAFVFSISHPSSYLNIGVFDYDAGGDLIADHDLIGRVSVDLTNFRSGTEYMLSYSICPTSRVASGRESKGKLMIRLRMEVADERKLAMAALRPPEPVYVNTKSRKEFRVIRQTCFGSIDEGEYSVTTLKSYIDELYELQHALFYIEDAVMSLLFWRGHCLFTIPWLNKIVDIPIHSICAFLIAITLVETPTLIPSFCFGSLAWFLLAIGGWRQESENVWWRCHSYIQILNMLLLGDDYAQPHRIQPFENFESAKKEQEDWMKRIEESEKRAARLAEEANAAEIERQRDLAEIGELETDLATKMGGGLQTLDPVRAALYPIQMMLGILIKVVRVCKNVILWQEAYFSFWIVTGSLVMAILSLFVPWFWCIKWGSRIVAWTIFGPWMKLVDIYYIRLLQPETEEERERRKKAERLKQRLATDEAVLEARVTRENIAKTKAMKKYMFGRYALRVPIIKQDRYADIPLADSFATPYSEKDFSLAKLAMEEAGLNRKRIPGQTLVGDMIPYVKSEDFTLAPVGKAALHTEKLSKTAPGARGAMTNQYRIVSAVAIAAAITYVGTPTMATLLSHGAKWISSDL